MLSETIDAELLRRVTAPTLVLHSERSTTDLTEMAAVATELLPRAVHRSLPGEWHTVPADALAAVLRDFLR